MCIFQGPTINGVLNRIVDELKQILKKDFNKKMIESTAFKQFDAWWDEHKKTEKIIPIAGIAISNSIPTVNSEAPAPSTPGASAAAAAVANSNVASTPKEEPKNQGFASLLEQATAPLGLNYDGFSLGIRASIPKMPSFRVSFILPFKFCV